MKISISKKKCFKREIWDFSNVNTSALNDALLLNDWGSLFDTVFDIDYIYEIWFKTVYVVVKSYLPLKSVVIRPRDKLWMNNRFAGLFINVIGYYIFIILGDQIILGNLTEGNVILQQT
jgi:hypothetical protein